MLLTGVVASVAAGLVSVLVTWLVKRYAAPLGLIQPPNARSSHRKPTPSGGGLGIAAGGTIAALPSFEQGPGAALLVVLASLAMAAIGFIDDRRPIEATVRLSAQVVLVVALLFVLPLPPIAAALGLESLGLVLAVVLAVAAVYWINLFNFMDGIDGLAGSEAAFVLAAAVVLALSAPGAPTDPHLWWMVGLLAAAIGFLFFNFPPARIFMGDVGSTYLGFMIAWFALSTVAAGWLGPLQWLILVALFVSDATVTLVRRFLQGEKVFEAHRRHAYQVLSRRWQGHMPVTLLAAAVNVVWLLPLAWWAGLHPPTAWLALLLAYLPLVAGAIWAGAGAPEHAAF